MFPKNLTNNIDQCVIKFFKIWIFFFCWNCIFFVKFAFSFWFLLVVCFFLVEKCKRLSNMLHKMNGKNSWRRLKTSSSSSTENVFLPSCWRNFTCNLHFCGSLWFFCVIFVSHFPRAHVAPPPSVWGTANGTKLQHLLLFLGPQTVRTNREKIRHLYANRSPWSILGKGKGSKSTFHTGRVSKTDRVAQRRPKYLAVRATYTLLRFFIPLK